MPIRLQRDSEWGCWLVAWNVMRYQFVQLNERLSLEGALHGKYSETRGNVCAAR